MKCQYPSDEALEPAMDVEPFGLPPALKAWRAREPEPVLALRCAATPECQEEVGAVYRSPQGLVAESRISVPEKSTPGPLSSGPMPDLDSFAGDIGVVGILDDFDVSTAGGEVEVSAALGEGPGAAGEGSEAAGEGSGAEGSGAAGEGSGAAGEDGDTASEERQKVKVQVDLVSTSHYWYDPAPLCPYHGKLQLDRSALDRAARQGETTFEAVPR